MWDSPLRYTLSTRLARRLRKEGRPLPLRVLGEVLALRGPVEPVLLPLLDGRFWRKAASQEEVGLWEWNHPFPPQGERVVVLDLEATGLAPENGEIIEIGLVVLEGGAQKTLSRLVRPFRPPSPFVSRLTGLTWDVLQEAPPLEEVLLEIYPEISEATLVLHNAGFDLSFLRPALGRLGFSLSGPVVDTTVLARRALPGVRRVGLDALARILELEPKERHRALGDALLTRDVLYEVYYILTSGRPALVRALGGGGGL